MTLLGYFNSLRELGGSRRIVEDEVRTRLQQYSRRKRRDPVDTLFSDRNLLQRIPGGFTGGQAQPGNILSHLLYLPSGQMAQIDYGNGVRTSYASDSRLRLNNLLTVSQPSTLNQQLINFAYDFDGVSNIKSITDRRPDTTVPANDPRRNTQVFRYDDLYRLTHVSYVFAVPPPSPPAGWAESQSEVGQINYRYDRIGNMLARTSTPDLQTKLTFLRLPVFLI